MNFEQLMFSAWIFKKSPYLQNHVNNETSDQRKNCHFCQVVMKSFIEGMTTNRNDEMIQMLSQLKSADEMIKAWEHYIVTK